MIITTTPSVEGAKVAKYLGVITGEAILGANAVIGVNIDYESFGKTNGMMMVSATDTAVIIDRT